MRGTAIDLPEVLPSPSPPSSSSHFSPGRHYYVAVDRLQFKMETLVDLLGVAGRRRSLPMVICCSSRDELDAVCASVSNLSFISLSSLYSDLAESERVLVLEKFRQSTAEWSQINNACPGDDLECGNVAHKSWMIVVTDACLPLVASGEAPLLARVLINYELPTKKETYLRRMSTCLAADGIVINMVVGGEVVALKGLEESSGLVIAEMPINISEIL
ncbi:eukaryotic initiation factor 4A-7 [Phoenix dactylifera]|uniref:Eukaryotic initiation factor 4A-7 n=1 Tax=Phoenix dactylifera TaxID=42345 RepID=A0A8B9AH04_PHODC|nr:eukaryotic initiation factor 4A-7 [Phoenix dactylifera]